MSINDKLLFIADYIEPNRPWFRPELLELACHDPDEVLCLSLSEKLCFTIKKQGFVHKDSIDCWNWYLAEKRRWGDRKQKLELPLTSRSCRMVNDSFSV
jgi:HD superfamily phosphohydrolase YqeK